MAFQLSVPTTHAISAPATVIQSPIMTTTTVTAAKTNQRAEKDQTCYEVVWSQRGGLMSHTSLSASPVITPAVQKTTVVDIQPTNTSMTVAVASAQTSWETVVKTTAASTTNTNSQPMIKSPSKPADVSKV